MAHKKRTGTFSSRSGIFFLVGSGKIKKVWFQMHMKRGGSIGKKIGGSSPLGRRSIYGGTVEGKKFLLLYGWLVGVGYSTNLVGDAGKTE